MCPLEFGQCFPTLKQKFDGPVVAANGQELRQYGTRTVFMVLEDGAELVVNFRVIKVTRPILSVGAMLKKGFRVSFEHPAFVEKDSRRVRLVRINNLWFLPVKLQTPQSDISAVNPSTLLPTLYEWCCDRYSLLGDYM